MTPLAARATASCLRVYAVGLNTFREAIRNKVLYGILAVVVGVNLFALVLGEMSLSEEARVARDVGLAGVSLFGAITAIVLGVSLLHTEVQKRTIHAMIAKPLGRPEFVVGKYLGMAATLTLLVACFAVALAGLLHLQGVPFAGAVVKAVVLGWLEVLVVAGIAVLFSAFSTPFLSGIFTLAIFFIGRVTPELRHAAARARDEWIRRVAEGALAILPDLDVFAISGGEHQGVPVSVHADFVPWSYVGDAAVYAGAWIVLLLIGAALVFSRRDFT
ncbi:MAG: ABC transporter permease [Myxococcales bacterium]|nr:ABC transporter permease [Myxococcales bacterium]